MAYSTNISFHGVSRIVVGKVSTHERHGKTWQAVSLTLYDDAGECAELVQFHSDDNGTLTIEHEAAPKAEAA